MTSRERLIATLNHQQPDRIPLDLGATSRRTLFRQRLIIEKADALKMHLVS